MSANKILKKRSGRNATGHITARHIGGRAKRYYRTIDFKRDKLGILGKVISFDYDPNRNVDLVLVQYTDGEKRYILRPLGLNIGDTLMSGDESEVKPGNCLPIKRMPVGSLVHNVELHKKSGGQLIRGAGTAGVLLAIEGGFGQIKLPSGEVRKVDENCLATVGQLANIEWKNRELGRAGVSRHMGRRPKVRGTAQDPRSHPHGGGEGRSGEGMKQPKTPWGKPARGLKTRKKKKYSNKYILQRRK